MYEKGQITKKDSQLRTQAFEKTWEKEHQGIQK